MFIVEIVQDGPFASSPGYAGPLEGIVSKTLVGRLQVELQSLEPRVSHPCSRIVARHAWHLATKDSKLRNGSTLAIHVEVGVDLLHLLIRVEDCMQGFQADVLVPDPVVREEGFLTLVHLVVESAVVLTVLVDVHHAFEAAVERRVEDALMRICASCDLNLIDDRLPRLAGSCAYFVVVELWNLALQIVLRLLHADKGNAIAHHQLSFALSHRSDHHALLV